MASAPPSPLLHVEPQEAAPNDGAEFKTRGDTGVSPGHVLQSGAPAAPQEAAADGAPASTAQSTRCMCALTIRTGVHVFSASLGRWLVGVMAAGRVYGRWPG